MVDEVQVPDNEVCTSHNATTLGKDKNLNIHPLL